MVMAQKSSRSFKKSHVRYNSKIWFGKEQDLEEYPSVQMHASKVNKTLQDVSFPSPHSKKPCFLKALNISFSNLECRCCKKKSSTIFMAHVSPMVHISHIILPSWETPGSPAHVAGFPCTSSAACIFVLRTPKKKGPCKVPVMKKSHLGQGGMSIYSSNFGTLQLIRFACEKSFPDFQ